jgi:hypothetical protein
MNLLQIRQQFRILSGRYDLVNDDGSDNGADFFIQEACKYLDRLDETQKSWATVYKWLPAGLFAVSFQTARAIKEVWVATADERWQLEKVKFQDFKANYMNVVNSLREQGDAAYYTPLLTRYIPENAMVTDLEAFTGFVEIPSGNAALYNAIAIAPTTDVTLMVEITGLFYSMKLSIDTHENYWSIAHPMLLIMATMRQVEVINRNTQGVNDWDSAIRIDMQQLGFDLVEELIAEVDDMEA